MSNVSGASSPTYPFRTTTGDPPPGVWPSWPSWPQTSAPVPTIPSFQEQMGIDPISKLAAAIEKLADALKESK